MSQRLPPIAHIRLARSVPRLLLAPAVFALAGAAAVAAGLVQVGGPVGILLAGLGGIVTLGAAVSAAVLLSVRLEVEESAVGVTWIGGERIYPLSPGPVTRVRLRGEQASRLRARTGALGWALGRARLRGEEQIEVVRLRPTATAILIPTDRGRLAIAPANEEELLAALSRAARARQRLAALVERGPEEAAPEPTEVGEPAEAAQPPQPPPDEPPRELTGIERAMLERRRAEEPAAAVPAATEATTAPPPVEAMPPAPPTARRRLPRLRRARSVPRGARRAAAFVLLPVAAAGVAWGAGVAFGRMPPAGTDLARLTWLALVLAGPATSIAAVMALAWWPRIVGVVVAGGLVASVFIGRALVGGLD